MSQDTVKIEPIPEDESFLDRLSREGKLDTFVNFLISTISLILGIAILGILAIVIVSGSN